MTENDDDTKHSVSGNAREQGEGVARTAGGGDERGRLREVAWLALRLGLTAFGGPAAHVAMLRHETTVRRKWLDDKRFLDLLGATNLIPGPNSTEMVMHIGRVRAGGRGLVAAGVLFILPAALMVLALAWAYVEYGETQELRWALYGVQPVVIAVVVQAIWGLSRTALSDALLASVGVGALALYLLGVNELALIFGGGAVILLARNARRILPSVGLLPAVAAPTVPSWLPTTLGQAAQPFDLLRMFGVFLKIGALLYGSGYVLLAFLRNDFVNRLHWLTDQQLLDAVAIGQVTPGPVFTTATFIGYVLGGVQGAVLATVAIFLPGFFFVALVNPLVPRLRSSPLMSAMLDGVNAAALGLMAAVALELGRAAVVDALTAALALTATLLLVRYKFNSVWLVLAGALVSIAYKLWTN